MYVIKNQLMATFLMSKGFKLIKLDVDRNDKTRNVYLFSDTPLLRNAMKEFKR